MENPSFGGTYFDPKFQSHKPMQFRFIKFAL
jgi:hypothetical protein